MQYDDQVILHYGVIKSNTIVLFNYFLAKLCIFHLLFVLFQSGAYWSHREMSA